MTLAYRIIRSEHYEIGLVMKSLHALADGLNEETWRPDFELLFLILDYAESFPATFHHPKEENYLFNAVRRRNPDAAPLLDQLCDDHAEALDLVSNLRQSLETYVGCPAARLWFHNAAKSYARHEREHMRREERTVLPLALQVLGKDDWAEIDEAFEGNSNPLLATRRRDNFDKMFALILKSLPGAVVFDTRRRRMREGAIPGMAERKAGGIGRV